MKPLFKKILLFFFALTLLCTPAILIFAPQGSLTVHQDIEGGQKISPGAGGGMQ